MAEEEEGMAQMLTHRPHPQGVEAAQAEGVVTYTVTSAEGGVAESLGGGVAGIEVGDLQGAAGISRTPLVAVPALTCLFDQFWPMGTGCFMTWVAAHIAARWT